MRFLTGLHCKGRLQPCLQIFKLGWNGQKLTNTLAYYGTVIITTLTSFIVLRPYLQHFISFVAYEWAQYARMLHNARLESFLGTNSLAY